MLKDREKLYQLYHVILSAALTWAFALVLNQYFILRVPFFVTASFSLALILLLYVFDLTKKNVICYIIVFCIILLLALIFWLIKFNPFKWILNFTSWCRVYNGTEELYSLKYAVFAVFIASLAGAIILYLLMKNEMSKLIIASIILVALVVLCISKVNVSKAVVGISIFYIMTIVIELYGNIYNKKAGRKNKKEGMLYLAPVCLLLCVLATGLPSHQYPIKWTIVKKTYHGILNQIETWKTDFDYYFGSGEMEFFMTSSGYSDDNGNLDKGGRLVKDNNEALKVSGLKYKDSVYLAGSIADIYTGSSWKKSKKDYLSNEKDYFLDYTELALALSRQNRVLLKNSQLVKTKDIVINYNNIKTKTLFYPLKTSNLNIYSSDKKLSEDKPQITFNRARGKGTSYQSTYFEMNLKDKAFQNMLKESDTFSYDKAPVRNMETEEWVQEILLYSDKVDNLMARNDIYEVLAKRSELIESRYTELPKELPDRVRQLAYNITAGYNNTYDKLKAIEAYLINYTYTLEPGKVPKGRDFVDYFLFDNKKGYCTSYATAMAVLGRCIGVPMRYVEGFVVRCDKNEWNYQTPVKNSDAHAWAEAYLEGIGWIPFEATAPFYDTRYTKWAPLTKQDTNENSESGTSDDYSYYQRMYQNNQMDQMNSLKEDQKDKIKARKHYANEILGGLAIIFIVSGCLIISIFIYYYILKHQYKKVFQTASNSGKTYMLFLRVLKLLQREGFSLGQQETILMLSKRVKNLYEYKNVTFIKVAEIFMLYRYGEEEISKEDFSKVETFYLGLSAKQKGEMSRFKAWLNDFTFLIQADWKGKRQNNNA